MFYNLKRNCLFGSVLIGGILLSCTTKDTSAAAEPAGSCYVQLFDGDNFKDDNITVNGPASFSNLRALPGSHDDWNDEADALKVGPKSTLVVWPQENFQGDSTVFRAGAQVAKLQVEIRSMKIRCN